MNHDQFDDGSQRTVPGRPVRLARVRSRRVDHPLVAGRTGSEDGPHLSGDREWFAFVGWDEA